MKYDIRKGLSTKEYESSVVKKVSLKYDDNGYYTEVNE